MQRDCLRVIAVVAAVIVPVVVAAQTARGPAPASTPAVERLDYLTFAHGAPKFFLRNKKPHSREGATETKGDRRCRNHFRVFCIPLT